MRCRGLLWAREGGERAHTLELCENVALRSISQLTLTADILYNCFESCWEEARVDLSAAPLLGLLRTSYVRRDKTISVRSRRSTCVTI